MEFIEELIDCDCTIPSHLYSPLFAFHLISLHHFISHITAKPYHQRYSFIPFNTEGETPATAKAHEHINLLQRWCKRQEKTIKKLVKTVKDLKDKLSCTPSTRARSEETVVMRNTRKRRAEISPTPYSQTEPLDIVELTTPFSMSS
ncbi:unnamed protein product [Microthlaspi erraticum]|uniref:Arabidopsis retrotransposon Orf1 C-terminal domain-containing protein n=1 Tax=Microthlaspi erraticum TaxID=1685480 RepID=A0A6D2JSS5_9BRAS|nr:unnamed protein product [Microthlaspi erraticum]